MKKMFEFLRKIFSGKTNAGKTNAGKAVALVTAFVVAVGLVLGNVTAAADGENSDLPYGGEFGPCEVSGRVKGFSQFPSSKFNIYNETEAEAAGVPSGYKGNVVEAGPLASPGVTFDFSAAKINVFSISSITFKVYIESTDGDTKTGDAHYPEIRIPYPGVTDRWAVRYDASSRTDRWFTMTIYADGTNMQSDCKSVSGSENALMSLADEDGYLKMFELAVRRHSGKGRFFVDYVKINYEYDSGKGPEITYNGPESIKLAKGARILLDASAWDCDEKRATPVKIDWAEGTVLEEDGFPAVGTNAVLLVSSADGFGNRTELKINAEIVPEDKVPPVINVSTDQIKCLAGTIPQMRDDATDDLQLLSVEYEWQKGALDSLGRLNAGTFEVKIIAEDTSGNVSEKTVSVTAGGPEVFDGFNVTNDEEG